MKITTSYTVFQRNRPNVCYMESDLGLLVYDDFGIDDDGHDDQARAIAWRKTTLATVLEIGVFMGQPIAAESCLIGGDVQ